MVLVVAAKAITDPIPIAHERSKRQVDTSDVTDAELLCGLLSSLNGEPCNENVPSGSNSSPIEANCKCTPVWQCKDDRGPTGE